MSGPPGRGIFFWLTLYNINNNNTCPQDDILTACVNSDSDCLHFCLSTKFGDVVNMIPIKQPFCDHPSVLANKTQVEASLTSAYNRACFAQWNNIQTVTQPWPYQHQIMLYNIKCRPTSILLYFITSVINNCRIKFNVYHVIVGVKSKYSNCIWSYFRHIKIETCQVHEINLQT